MYNYEKKRENNKHSCPTHIRALHITPIEDIKLIELMRYHVITREITIEIKN